MNKRVLVIIVSIILVIILRLLLFKGTVIKEIFTSKKEIIDSPVNVIKEIKISAVGDCTIGWDTNFGYTNYGYYFANVKDLFAKDDLTIANLETTFTNYDVKTPKKWNFSSPPEYIDVLLKGNIDIVSIANNHTYDYGEKGYNDTIDTLKKADIPYYGNNIYYIKEIDGIKIGFFGLLDIYGQKFSEVDKAIKYLKDNNCDLIIASMHWGIEYDYEQSNEQVKMGHYLIDNGVDLVIGHHPHIVQGIEKYHNKYIVYSLGNFSFGGNSLPRDMDTFIWQQTFSFINGELELDDNINIIPTYVSSKKNTNNYQPTILEGEEAEKNLTKIMKYSSGFTYKKYNLE